jgi:hypothetical protein
LATPADFEGNSELRAFERRLEQARRELLETSTRSRLLHTPLGSSRAKIVEIQDEVSDQVLRILVTENKPMSFLSGLDDSQENEGGTLRLPQPEDEGVGPGGVARRHSDTRLQTALRSDRLQARLRAIAYDAQSIEDEQGFNILYLALGFLKWYEVHDSEKPRFAPLVLIPVSLARASVNERFKISYDGQDLGTNLPLQQRLKEAGIDLPNLSESEDFLPSHYCLDLKERIQGLAGWDVLPNTIVLGFFSFAKLMMYRDLDMNLWPRGTDCVSTES